jgi:hypothetical protein
VKSRVPPVERIEVNLEGLHQLRRRIDRQQLEAADWAIVGALVWKLIARTEARQQRMLAKLAAAAAAAQNPGAAADPVSNTGQVASPSGTSATDNRDGSAPGSLDGVPTGGGARPADEPQPKQKAAGHGRNGAGAYTNAQHFFYALVGVVGLLCQACRMGPMSRYREKLVVVIKGQPQFCAQIHHHEQARCKLCGRIVRAEGPDYVEQGVGSSYVSYDWSACAMLIVMHYFGGAPFKRLESLHQGWGVPLADANQWTLVDQSHDLLLPLYKAVERYGIQKAQSLRIDDTGSMVITIRRRIEAEVAALEAVGESTKDIRTGINATGVYLDTGHETIILFYTGRHHAGEILDQLMRHRGMSSNSKLVKVTDGATKNFDHQHADKLIEATCNAHALLKFRDIRDKYPDEYAVAGEVYKKVFDHDDKARQLGLGPVDRMLYHRQHSKPQMDTLKAMCEEKIKSKLVEPTSLLWQPLTFIINQWERLVRFCEEPGVPLDTNLVEQALIIPVRYLAGSFNYQTDIGAVVGDCHMSLIATARANKVEPVAYLTDCLRNHQDLAKRPEYYLPWVYRERLAKPDPSPRQPPRPGGGPAAPPPGQDPPPKPATAPGTAERPILHSSQATLRHSSGNPQRAGSPPQIRI